jgi:hypothetical protein
MLVLVEHCILEKYEESAQENSVATIFSPRGLSYPIQQLSTVLATGSNVYTQHQYCRLLVYRDVNIYVYVYKWILDTIQLIQQFQVMLQKPMQRIEFS